MSGLKNFFTRILINPGTLTAVTSDVPVRVMEQLEDSVTYVAEFNVIEEDDILTSNIPVEIDQVDFMVDDGSGYNMRRMFTGVINHITGTSYPNQAKVTCTGTLAKLRLTRPTDLDLSGMTDGEAVMAILTYCGISYDPDDIADYGYVLGAIKPVIWQKGTPASQIVQELDRVFAMATIEIGTGRVVRIPYSRVPYDYDGSAIVRSFVRGDASTEFYDNTRERGDIDAIQNYWRVSGLSYDGATDTEDEGCNFTIWAEGIDNHPKLGAGVYIGPNEFSSDVIQSEILAKRIAQRLMRWHNREPDFIRVVTLNDTRTNVGDVIAVRDQIFGIDLPDAKRYLILNISRDGDDMTIDAVGGPHGGEGTITSGIERCCGTQQEDGTCVETGTNPDPGSGPDPGTPPDSPTGHCDPIADPTCIPGFDYTLPPAPNVEDRFINCTDSGEAIDLVDAPWRHSSDIHWRYDVESDTTLGIYTLTNGTITYNTTPPPTPKTTSNDVLFSGGDVVCVSGTVKFCAAEGENPHLRIEQFPAPDSAFGTWAYATFYAESFLAGYPTQELFGAQMASESSVGHYDPRAALHACAPDLVASSNDGGLSGVGLGYETEGAFNVCFAVNQSPQRVYYDGSWGSGYKEDISCPEHGFDEPPACPHDHHIIKISLSHPLDTEATTVDCPKVELTSLSLGFGTCELNPDYVDPFAELGG